jgi:hypothetical protein
MVERFGVERLGTTNVTKDTNGGVGRLAERGSHEGTKARRGRTLNVER